MSRKNGNFQSQEMARSNFLLQASALLAQQQPSLSSFYAQNARKVLQKTVSRTRPNMKNLFCTGCNCVLIAGMNYKSRIRGKQEMKYRKNRKTCSNCLQKQNGKKEQDRPTTTTTTTKTTTLHKQNHLYSNQQK